MLSGLDKNISIAYHVLNYCKGKVIVFGIGKSGYIEKKIAVFS